MFLIASESVFIDKAFGNNEIERLYFETCSKIENTIFPVQSQFDFFLIF